MKRVRFSVFILALICICFIMCAAGNDTPEVDMSKYEPYKYDTDFDVEGLDMGKVYSATESTNYFTEKGYGLAGAHGRGDFDFTFSFDGTENYGGYEYQRMLTIFCPASEVPDLDNSWLKDIRYIYDIHISYTNEELSKMSKQERFFAAKKAAEYFENLIDEKYGGCCSIRGSREECDIQKYWWGKDSYFYLSYNSEGAEAVFVNSKVQSEYESCTQTADRKTA